MGLIIRLSETLSSQGYLVLAEIYMYILPGIVLASRASARVLASRVSRCLFGTLDLENHLFWGEKTPYLLGRIF